MIVTKKKVNINIFIVVESLLTLKNILKVTSNKHKLYNLYDWLIVSNRLSAFISINSFSSEFQGLLNPTYIIYYL